MTIVDILMVGIGPSYDQMAQVQQWRNDSLEQFSAMQSEWWSLDTTHKEKRARPAAV